MTKEVLEGTFFMQDFNPSVSHINYISQARCTVWKYFVVGMFEADGVCAKVLSAFSFKYTRENHDGFKLMGIRYRQNIARL